MKRIRIDVLTESGAPLLTETHNLSYGPLGLLRVPKRLELFIDDMVCFPSKEESMDSSNLGVLYDAVCNTFPPGCGPVYTKTLVSTGFSISDDFVCLLWIRAASTINTTPVTCDTASKSRTRRLHSVVYGT